MLFACGALADVDTDLAFRDQLPQTDTPIENRVPIGVGWGPWPKTYPAVVVPPQLPANVSREAWLRDHVIFIAKHYVGLPYKHKHIPLMGGLDCSNFTAWVYNFGFGVRLNSNIAKQSETAGRKLAPDEKMEPGDLIFLWSRDDTRISHVMIRIDDEHVIDSSGVGVQVRPWTGWRHDHFAWARRIF